MDPRAAGHSRPMATITPGLPLLAARPSEREAELAPAEAPAQSFQAIYAEHVDQVWRSLRGLGVPRSSVEDAVQDVFLVVHRRLGAFEGRSTVRTWLFGIVLHTARNHRRQERRKGGCDPLDADIADGGPGPHEEAATAETLHRLAEVLEDLDEQKREVFVLSELLQMTAPEIAGALGINVNTVYSRQRKARLAFAAALQRRKEAGR
jgi:RNA polymerase sigma-70 factor (ECF subfamily)